LEARVSDVVRIGVLASGRGSNFAALASASADGSLGARVVCLITDNPDAGALALARDYGIPSVVLTAAPRRARLDAASEEQIVAALRAHRVDLVCLAGFMRILGAGILAAYPRAILNIHPSLLPSFPGLDAQRQALEHGVRISGCTVHLVDAGIDTGAILAQTAVPVHPDDTPATLTARILDAEHRLYPRAVRDWVDARSRDREGAAPAAAIRGAAPDAPQGERP